MVHEPWREEVSLREVDGGGVQENSPVLLRVELQLLGRGRTCDGARRLLNELGLRELNADDVGVESSSDHSSQQADVVGIGVAGGVQLVGEHVANPAVCARMDEPSVREKLAELLAEIGDGVQGGGREKVGLTEEPLLLGSSPPRLGPLIEHTDEEEVVRLVPRVGEALLPLHGLLPLVEGDEERRLARHGSGHSEDRIDTSEHGTEHEHASQTDVCRHLGQVLSHMRQPPQRSLL
mmetsp:Transcript_36847/g.115364  ORF Transcript_36847/g.115364 Transcript_36847/m.115364 type:complete len:236 (-) Transcript_36847:2037-2744(-)